MENKSSKQVQKKALRKTDVVRSCLCKSCFPDGKIGEDDLTKELLEGNKKVVHRVGKA